MSSSAQTRGAPRAALLAALLLAVTSPCPAEVTGEGAAGDPESPGVAGRPSGARSSGEDSSAGAADTRRSTGAAEVIMLDPTTISGHRELPRVMHVVPWKRALPAQLQGRPINSLLDDVLAPVDREVFRRQLRYHDALANKISED